MRWCFTFAIATGCIGEPPAEPQLGTSSGVTSPSSTSGALDPSTLSTQGSPGSQGSSTGTSTGVDAETTNVAGTGATGEPATTTGGSACGDGVVDEGEECDDRNQTVGDGCSAACLDENVWCETEVVGMYTAAPSGELAAANGFMYFGAGPSQQETLRIVDATDPSKIVETASLGVELSDEWNGHSVQYKDGYVATGGPYTGMAIVDVDPPGSPEVVFTLQNAGPGGGVVIEGDLLYKSAPGSGGERLQIWDVSDMAKPSMIHGYMGWEDQYYPDFAAASGYAALVGPPFLEIWDTSPPESPSLVAQLTNVDTTQIGRVVADTDTVIIVGAEVLHVDYSMPNLPHLETLEIDLPFAVHDVALREDFIYLPVTNGLQVWDISIPEDPVLAGVYLEPASATFAVALDDEYAYIATDFGIRILRGLPGLCGARCGNNHIEYPEQCDDGGVSEGDGCSATCVVE